MSTAVRVIRHDVVTGASTLAQPVQLPNGSWVLAGYATRTGVFPYRNADGSTRYELRHPDEVGPTATQLALCALTDEHPRGGLVTPANAAELQRGLVLEASWEPEPGRVPVRVLVTHQSLLEGLAAGKKELSCGYTCETVPEEGEYQGERYTHRQRGIVYNHLAVVEAGRAGPECALRLDSAGNVLSSVDTRGQGGSDVGDIPQPTPPPLGGREESPVEKEIVINGITFKVPGQVAEALMAERAAWEAKFKEVQGVADKRAQDMAGMEEEKKKLMASANAEKEAITAKLDSAMAEVAQLKKLHADAADPAKQRELIQSRLKLERQVHPVLGDNYVYATADDMQLKMDALEKLLPADSPLVPQVKAAAAEKRYVYLDGIFDSVLAQHRAAGDSGGAAPERPQPSISVNSLILKRQQGKA